MNGNYLAIDPLEYLRDELVIDGTDDELAHSASARTLLALYREKEQWRKAFALEQCSKKVHDRMLRKLNRAIHRIEKANQSF